MLTISVIIALLGYLVWLLQPQPQLSVHEQVVRLRDFVEHNLTLTEEVFIEPGNRGLLLPDVVKAAQAQLDYRLKANGVRLRFKLIDNLPKKIEPALESRPLVEVPVTTDDMGDSILKSVETASIKNLGSVDTKVDTDSPSQHEKEIRNHGPFASKEISVSGSNDEMNLKRPTYNDRSVRALELYFYDTPHMWVDMYAPIAFLAYNLEQTHRNDVPFFVTQALYDALLKPDIEMWEQMSQKQNDASHQNQTLFDSYRKEIKINFIAAEESGDSPADIIDGIKKYMERYSIIEPFVHVTTSVQILDVSKRRAAKHLTKNTTLDLTFFYLTSLRPYANSVQGVPLYHISPEEPPSVPPHDHYGTAYEDYEERLNTVVYNISDFLLAAAEEINTFVGLPISDTQNLHLKTASALKHYTVLGIKGTLSKLLDPERFSQSAFSDVCQLLDTLMVESHHNWLDHLPKIHNVYNSIA